MSIEEILDDMDELLDKATALPFQAHKVMIDGERLRELINDARLNVPQEIKHAKMVEFDRDRIIKEAEAKAEKTIHQAEEQAKEIVSEEAVVKEAKKRALEVVNKAMADSDNIRGAANNYVRKRFKEMEAYFEETETYFQQMGESFSKKLENLKAQEAQFNKLTQKKAATTPPKNS